MGASIPRETAMKNKILRLLAALLAAAAVTASRAYAFSVDLNVPNVPVPGVSNFATVDGSLNPSGNTLSFAVQVDPGLYAALGGSGPVPPTFGMDAFYFVTDLVTRDHKGRVNGLDPSLSLTNFDPATWEINRFNVNVSSFGLFSVELKDDKHNAVTPSLLFDAVWNGSPFAPGETLEDHFLISATGDPSGANMFAAHIRFGFDDLWYGVTGRDCPMQRRCNRRR